MSSDFVPFALGDDLHLDLGRVQVRAWTTARRWAEGTAWGLVTEGPALLRTSTLEARLPAGAWFVVPDAGEVVGGVGLLILDAGPRGLPQVGGPIEARGRLQYIDGCTDTLLVCPPRLGDPSLNHLHIPPGTVQQRHTHNSDRIGVIVRGHGIARASGRTALRPGLGWWIPAGTEHAFTTEGAALDVLAWHPDSTFGPTDEVHPMKIGTLLPDRA